MEFMRVRRQELGLTQQQLAKLCEVPRQRICEIENGYSLPDQATAARLESALGLQSIPNSSQVLCSRVLRKLVRPKPYELKRVDPEPWANLGKVYPYLMARIKAPAQVLSWMKRCFHCDALSEGLGLAQWAAAGAKPCLANPHGWGYRRLPIYDSLGFLLGERMLPALHWVRAEFECVIWPQIKLRPKDISYRVDFLVLLRIGGITRWYFVEIDGPSHTAEQDKYRTEQLGLTPIRVTTDEVKKLRFVECVTAQILADHKKIKKLGARFSHLGCA